MVTDLAHYEWSSYRHNRLGQANRYLTPHPVYLELNADDESRLAAYRALFRSELDAEALSDIRLAINQNQPLGNSRFYAHIDAMTGQRREPKPRGRPRKEKGEAQSGCDGQLELPF